MDSVESYLHAYRENNCKAVNGPPAKNKEIYEILSWITKNVKHVAVELRQPLTENPISDIKNNNFDKNNLDDIVFLIFKFIASQNKNPRFFSEEKTWHNHTKHIIFMYFLGATYQLSPNLSNGVHAEKFSDAEIELIKIDKKSHNSFY